MCAKLLQQCPTLCDSMDCSLPGSSVRGILQAGILEWVAMPSSRGSSQPGDRTQVFHIAGGFFPSEPPRKPKNTGVSSLSLLQGQSCRHTILKFVFLQTWNLNCDFTISDISCPLYTELLHLWYLLVDPIFFRNPYWASRVVLDVKYHLLMQET